MAEIGTRRRGPTTATRLAVVAGGAVGTLVRLFFAEIPSAHVGSLGPALPVGTLAANLFGAAVLGWVAGRLGERRGDPRWAPLTGGLLGATTTFSTFAVEVADLLRVAPVLGLLWAAGSIGLGLALVHAGRRLGEGHAIGAAA